MRDRIDKGGRRGNPGRAAVNSWRGPLSTWRWHGRLYALCEVELTSRNSQFRRGSGEWTTGGRCAIELVVVMPGIPLLHGVQGTGTVWKVLLVCDAVLTMACIR